MRVSKQAIITMFKNEVNTKLEKRVLNSLLNKLDGYEGTIIEKFDNLFSDIQHGCQSGIVGELIYYTDTEKWFNLYKKDINDLVADYILEGLLNLEYAEDLNGNCFEVFRLRDISIKANQDGFNQSKFDIDQKNILAWFSYEEVADKFYNLYEGYKEAL